VSNAWYLDITGPKTESEAYTTEPRHLKHKN